MRPNSVLLLAVVALGCATTALPKPTTGASPTAPSTSPSASLLPETELATSVQVNDACAFTGNTKDKYRWAVKHRPPSSAASSSKKVDEILGWPDPAGVSDPKVRDPAQEDQLLASQEGGVAATNAALTNSFMLTDYHLAA